MAHRTSIKARINTGNGVADSIIMIVLFAFFVSLPLAWVTHVMWIIRKLANDAGVTVGQMILGALGAFMPPVGIVHGYMIWFSIGF